MHRTISIALSTLCIAVLVNCGPSNPDNTVEPTSSDDQASVEETSQTGSASDASAEQKVTSNKPTLVYYEMPG